MADTVAAAENPSQTSEKGSSEKEKQGNPFGGAKITLTGAPRQLAEFVSAMSRKNRILAGGLIVLIVAVSIFLALFLNRVQYAALYSGLSEEEAGEILSVLKDDGVDAKMEGTSTILVPEGKVDDLRVSLAANGYPKTGLNYDLFTAGSDFGATDLETRTRLQYTLQENLRTTIKNMSKIKDCIVIVNLATNSSYVVSSNTSPATAAVMLELEPEEEMSSEEAKSIAKFVMKSVPKLTEDNISIVDSNMQSYDISGEDSADSTYSATQLQLAEQMKKILSDQAMSILRPVLGSGNVAASVNLALDFDKETQSSVEFSPPIEGEENGMLRSLQESQDSTNSATGTSGAAGTSSNGVSATGYAGQSNGSGNSANSNSKTYNYELNELRTEIEKAQGKVSDLSVSVLINSDVDGAAAVAEQAKDLVANAIGVDPKYITISSLPFVESPDQKSFQDYYNENQAAATRSQWMSIMKVGLFCLTLLICVLLVLRFLKKRKEEEFAPEQIGHETQEDGDALLTDAEPMDELLLADLVHSKSGETEKVEKLIEDYPEAAVQILRNWLSDN